VRAWHVRCHKIDHMMDRIAFDVGKEHLLAAGPRNAARHRAWRLRSLLASSRSCRTRAGACHSERCHAAGSLFAMRVERLAKFAKNQGALYLVKLLWASNKRQQEAADHADRRQAIRVRLDDLNLLLVSHDRSEATKPRTSKDSRHCSAICACCLLSASALLHRRQHEVSCPAGVSDQTCGV